MNYKEILKGIVQIINTTEKSDIGFANICAYIGENCPELKESEDERIKKAIINTIEDCSAILSSDNQKRMIAWLEKQGKTALDAKLKFKVGDRVVLSTSDGEKLVQIDSIEYFKSGEPRYITSEGRWFGNGTKAHLLPDKVEPKFKVGDWIISNNKKSTYQVIEVKRGIYVIRDNADNHEYHIGIEECEKNGRRWNISDAKDGDILWHSNSASNGIFIFKEIRHTDGKVLCYCDYDSEDHFCTGEYHTCCWSSDNIKPATKEQRDHLFEKMKEAGYEWDKDKNELRKIEHTPT